MGYTHYFRGWLTISEQLIEDVQNIIDASGVEICDSWGEGQPELLEGELISLNGSRVNEEWHESLNLVHGVNHTMGSFCKTARKAYDVVVATVLLRAATVSRNFVVQSDGDWNEEEWLAARTLYYNVFGSEAPMPKHMRANAQYFTPVASIIPQPVEV